ncbi:MAG TPA: hypothetical protein VK363_11995 [Pyrinomonadaceae bacterium]|nr:hypothetical protein [Pyrinomonadaceae bacterium]
MSGVESEDGDFVKGVIIVITLKAISVSLNVSFASGARREYSDCQTRRAEYQQEESE